jgi:hypothetical protein
MCDCEDRPCCGCFSIADLRGESNPWEDYEPGGW